MHSQGINRWRPLAASKQTTHSFCVGGSGNMGNSIMPLTVAMHISTVGRCLTPLRPVTTHDSPSTNASDATCAGHSARRSAMLSQSSTASSQKSVRLIFCVPWCHSTEGRPVRICSIVLYKQYTIKCQDACRVGIITAPSHRHLSVCGTLRFVCIRDQYTLSTHVIEPTTN